MEQDTLYSNLLQETCDLRELAEDFLSQCSKPNIKLTNLLALSCGINSVIPANIIKNQNYKEIVKFFEKNTSNNVNSKIPLYNKNYYERFIEFFEWIITLKWNYFTNDGNLDNYLPRLMDLLSEIEPQCLRITCFVIRLKFVTGYLKSTSQPVSESVFCYAIHILKLSVRHKAVQCTISALCELQRWIQLNSFFTDDKLLRTITWSLKMESCVLVCTGLKIVYNLLNMKRLHKYFHLFVQKLTFIFEELIYSPKVKVFSGVCQCCRIIHLHFPGILTQSFVNALLDNLFHKNRDRAKIVAKFWIQSMFENSSVADIGKIIEFLSKKQPSLIKLAVDAMIEDYDVFIDWKLLARILNDKEKSRLSIEEKQNFLLILYFIIEETVTGLPPMIRGSDEFQPDIDTCSKFSEGITTHLAPVMGYLFALNYPDKIYAKTILLQIGIYMNFEKMESNVLMLFIKECYWVFENARLPPSMSVALEFMCSIRSFSNKNIQSLCDSFFLQFIPYCEEEFEKMIEDFLNNPDKYRNPVISVQEYIQITSTRIQVLNWQYDFPKHTSFDVPKIILFHRHLPKNPSSAFVQHVCIYLITEYAIRKILHVEQGLENSTSGLDIFETELVQIKVTFIALKSKLCYCYSASLRESAYLAICRLLEKAESEMLKDRFFSELFPDMWKSLITYVNIAISEAVPTEFEIKKSKKVEILRDFLDLVLMDKIPLLCTFDVLNFLSNWIEPLKSILTIFVFKIYKAKGAKMVSNWLIDWLKFVHKISTDKFKNSINQFVRLIIPIKKDIQDVIFLIQIKGISYSIELQKTEKPEIILKFFELLSEFCMCLEENNVKKIREHFLEQYNLDRRIVEYYLNSLKKSFRIIPAIQSPSIKSVSSGSEESQFLPSIPDSWSESSSEDRNNDVSDPRSNYAQSNKTMETENSGLQDVYEMHDLHEERGSSETLEEVSIHCLMEDMKRLKSIGKKKTSTSSSLSSLNSSSREIRISNVIRDVLNLKRASEENSSNKSSISSKKMRL